MEIKDLYPGKEVMVRRNKKEGWFLHWYKYTSKKGFHTEEYGKISFRYIVDRDFNLMGKSKHIEGELDFKSKECKNQIKELKKAFKDLW